MIEKKGLLFGVIAFLYNLFNLTVFSVNFINNPSVINAVFNIVLILLTGFIIFKALNFFFKVNYGLGSILSLTSISVLINSLFSLERLRIISTNQAVIFYTVITGIVLVYYYINKYLDKNIEL